MRFWGSMTTGSKARTCEYGFPDLCGKPATWICHPDKFPGSLYGCDDHAPLMVNAVQAHRLPEAPEMPLLYLKAYITALAWDAYLLMGRNPLRAENARSAFRMAKAEYDRRMKTA